jgi:hypothetical protein
MPASFDPIDQLERYVRWWHGHQSSTGRCFDIGATVRRALARFETTREPYCGSWSQCAMIGKSEENRCTAASHLSSYQLLQDLQTLAGEIQIHEGQTRYIAPGRARLSVLLRADEVIQ